MSASREKKKRQVESTAPQVTVVETKKGMSKGLKTTLGVVVAVILVAAIVFLGLVSGGYFETHSTAAIVNGHKLTPAMVNYYYRNTLSSENMQQMLSMFTDSEIPLDEQECPLAEEGTTWADYILNTALDTAAKDYAVYDEAVANGHTLSTDAATAAMNEVSNIELIAPMYGYTSADQFLTSQYGVGCNMENFQEYTTVYYMAQDYIANVYNSFSYEQADIDAYYAENPAEFDGYTYRIYNVHVEEEETEETEESEEEKTVDPEALAACEEIAKTIAEESKGNEQAYLDLVMEYAHEDEKEILEDTTTTLRKDYTELYILDVMKEWITDESRVEGDTTYTENGNDDGYYAIYFIGKEDHNYQLPNVRHILIAATDSTDAASMEDAKARADALLEEFLAGEATEEAFAALVPENSADTASHEDGGLYENIAPNTMVEAFDAWCFDENRQIGDTGIVETEYGYHIMYFSGYGETYHNNAVRTALLERDFTAWQEEATGNATYELKSTKYLSDF